MCVKIVKMIVNKLKHDTTLIRQNDKFSAKTFSNFHCKSV